MNKIISIAILGIFIFGFNVYGFVENYPPYSFKNGLPNALNIKPILSGDQSKFNSRGIVAQQDKDSFFLRDGRLTLLDLKGLSIANAWGNPVPMELYRVDLDKNGLEDFVVFSWYRRTGLASMNYPVDVFLKKSNEAYQRISYDSMNPDIKDFSDLNKDGKSEVIITGYYLGPKHNYFTYNVYEFQDFKLNNADQKFKGFPKFVWLTNKPNDKDTTHLTQKERKEHAEQTNRSISYN